MASPWDAYAPAPSAPWTKYSAAPSQPAAQPWTKYAPQAQPKAVVPPTAASPATPPPAPRDGVAGPPPVAQQRFNVGRAGKAPANNPNAVNPVADMAASVALSPEQQEQVTRMPGGRLAQAGVATAYELGNVAAKPWEMFSDAASQVIGRTVNKLGGKDPDMVDRDIARAREEVVDPAGAFMMGRGGAAPEGTFEPGTALRMGAEKLGLKSAAIRTPEGKILTGADHDMIRASNPETKAMPAEAEGFVDTKGQFHTREQALPLAKAAEQVKPDFKGELHSHDLKPAPTLSDAQAWAKKMAAKPSMGDYAPKKAVAPKPAGAAPKPVEPAPKPAGAAPTMVNAQAWAKTMSAKPSMGDYAPKKAASPEPWKPKGVEPIKPAPKVTMDPIDTELRKAFGQQSKPVKQAPIPAKEPPAKTTFSKYDGEYNKFLQDVAETGKNPFLQGLSEAPADRVARAKKLGFNTSLDLYHSTNKEYAAFDPEKGAAGEKAVFLSAQTNIAGKYKQGEGGHTIPVWAKFEKPWTVDWTAYNKGSSSYSNFTMQKLINEAKAEGYDSIIIKNIDDVGGMQQTQYAMLKPENLRAKMGAAFNPKYKNSANMLSAGASDPTTLPETPSKQFIEEQSDNFNRLATSAAADKSRLTNKLDTLPKELTDRATDKKFYQLDEGDKSVSVTPEEQALYDKHVEPLKARNEDLFAEARKYGLTEDDLPELNPNYVARMRKGQSFALDRVAGEGNSANPMKGNAKLAQSASAVKERVLYVIEDNYGRRKVVAIKKGSIALAERDKKFLNLKGVQMEGDGSPKLGGRVKISGKDYTIKQALTSELERATGEEYYQSAVASHFETNRKMEALVRAIYEFDRMKDSPEWSKYTMSRMANDVPVGWRTPKLPLARDIVMHPDWANVLDDFYGHDSVLPEVLRKFNDFATASLFWSPTKHLSNVGAHWWVARGWDNFTPAGMKSLIMDAPKAAREVIMQGELYQQMLKEGSSLLYSRTANKDFHAKMLAKVGYDIKKNPAKWDLIARAFGVGPSTLATMLYNGSAKVLWAGSDMMMMQRVMELQRKGMSAREAIKNAEYHIPNYRLPTKVLGSRTLQRAMGDTGITQFSRYHYGQWKSFAHMANAIVRGSGPEKLEAAGNIFAMLVFATFVTPLVTLAIQKLTGNKDIQVAPAGPLSIIKPQMNLAVQKAKEYAPDYVPDWLAKQYNGDTDFVNSVSNAFVFSPVAKAGVEFGMTGADSFTNKKIVEPADRRDGNIGRVAGQVAEKLAETFVQPYGLAAQADRSGQDLAFSAMLQALALENNSDEKKNKRDAAFYYQERDAAKRKNKPRGPIERLTE